METNTTVNTTVNTNVANNRYVITKDGIRMKYSEWIEMIRSERN